MCVTSAPQFRRCCLVQIEELAAELVGDVADAAAAAALEREADVVRRRGCR